jgi:hypothetical protein
MMPAAFTDHLAVTIRLSLESQSTRHGPSYWKMKASLLHETDFLHRLRVEWDNGKHMKNTILTASYGGTATRSAMYGSTSSAKAPNDVVTTLICNIFIIE